MSRHHIGRASAVALVAALVVLSVVPGVVAAEEQFGGTVVVEEGETVDGLSVVSGTVVVRGTVEGSLEGVAGSVVIAESGTVTGDVSIASGSLQIDGTVAGDVSAGVGSLTVGETGVVEGSVSAGTETAIVDGTVRGDVTVGAQRLELGPAAVVGGDLTIDDDTELVRADGATVSGSVVRSDLGRAEPVVVPGVNALVTVWGMVANLLLGALLLVLFPGFSRRVAADVSERPGRTGAAGLVAFVGVPLLIGLLVVSIVGIPIALLVGLPVAVLGGWIGLVYGEFAVGAWALDLADYENRWGALVAGVVGIGIVGLIPVVGGVVQFVVWLLGIGAITLGLYETWSAGRGEPPEVEERAAGEGGESAQAA